MIQVFYSTQTMIHIFFSWKVMGLFTKLKQVARGSSVELDSNWKGTTLSAEIDSFGNFYLFTLTSTEMIIITCLESSDCTSPTSWTEVGSNVITSGGYGLDSDISYDDEIWITYTAVNFSYCHACFRLVQICVIRQSVIGIMKQSVILEIYRVPNASLSIDIGVDKSIHIVHNNMTNGLQYSYCETTCTSVSSWTN